MTPEREPFFIGWAAAPPAAARFLAACAAGLVALFAAVAYLAAATAADPGDGAFRFDWGPQTATGIVEARPYPVLHVTASERWPAGRTLLLTGVGKTGLQDAAAPLDGREAQATGIVLKRGDLDMLQVEPRPEALAATGAPGAAPPPEALGRWRITGEICDGKCYAGAMRPGEGLAHRACASLCVAGGVPPVFVTTAPVEGARFLLLAGPDGGPLPAAALAETATLVEAEGALERRGSLLVFRVDPADIRRPQ
jgi:hypothetical protein